MLLSDERELFSHDRENLANMLANKTSREIEHILDCYTYRDYEFRLTKIYVTHQNFGTWYQRLAHIPVVPLLFLLAGVKWLFTGQIYLDSWSRKYKPIGVLYKMIGYKV